MTETITPQQFQEAEGVGDWRVVGDGACTFFRTGSFAEAARLVQAMSELPGLDTHHPDVDLRQDGVTVRLDHGDRGPLRHVDARRRAGSADLGGGP